MNSFGQPVVIDANVGGWSAVSGPGPSLEVVQDWLAGLDKIVVPALWVYEVTSALYRHRLQGWPPAEIDQALARVLVIPDEVVHPDRSLVVSAYEWAIRLEQGAAYDAFYLALAEGLGGRVLDGRPAALPPGAAGGRGARVFSSSYTISGVKQDN